MKKNDIIKATIIDVGVNCEGISKVDNIVIFVPFTLIGEIVKIQIIKLQSSFAYGKLLEVIQPSNLRTNPPCEVFTKCGGCVLQHSVYDNQLIIKNRIVSNAISKILGLDIPVLPTIPSECEYGYRNKIQIPVNTTGIGLFAINSHRIVPTDSCVVVGEWCQRLISVTKDFIKQNDISLYNETNGTGILRHIVARYIGKKLMVTYVINANELPHSDNLIKLLEYNFDSPSIYLCRNKKTTNVILTDDFIHLSGDKFQTNTMFGITYTISPASFSQINDCIMNKLYSKVLSLIPQNEIVIDAYSGAGLLTAIMSTVAQKVYGIEIIKPATDNADELVKINNIKNMQNINGDCKEELPKLITKLQGKSITVVLDPPRKGCERSVLETLITSSPNQIIYISCNPATLARDLKIICNDYHIEFIQPYDMFPQTKHIETLVQLTKI